VKDLFGFLIFESLYHTSLYNAWRLTSSVITFVLLATEMRLIASLLLTPPVLAPIIRSRMLIGLISDTHIREPATTLPPQIELAFRNVDLILHGGDIYISAVLDELERIAPVLAVSGDDDYGEVLHDKRVKPKQTLCLEGHKLWLVHENPYLHSLNPQSGMNSKVKSDPDSPDIVVFGHIHYSVVKQFNGVLLVNPGSPINNSHKLGTVATLRLETGKSEVSLLDLEELGQ
jgi:uncharacterized protein